MDVARNITWLISTLAPDPPHAVETTPKVAQPYRTARKRSADRSGMLRQLSAYPRRPRHRPLMEPGPRPLPCLPARRRRPARWHCQCDTAASGGGASPLPLPCKLCKWRVTAADIYRGRGHPHGGTAARESIDMPPSLQDPNRASAGLIGMFIEISAWRFVE